MSTGHRLLCKELLCFKTTPCRHMPSLVHSWNAAPRKSLGPGIHILVLVAFVMCMSCNDYCFMIMLYAFSRPPCTCRSCRRPASRRRGGCSPQRAGQLLFIISVLFLVDCFAMCCLFVDSAASQLDLRRDAALGRAGALAVRKSVTAACSPQPASSSCDKIFLLHTRVHLVPIPPE